MILDLFICIMLLPFWPFIYIYNFFLDRRSPVVCSENSAYSICLEILRKNNKTFGILASPNEYTDVWTRDAFFSIIGLKSKGYKWHQNTINTLTKYQRDDGLIPLYVGPGDACSKLICRAKPNGKIKPTYYDSKTGDVVTDSCFQYIILVGDCPASKRAWDFMQQFVKNGLIYENGLGSWMDTVYHCGHVLYTNMLYYKAAIVLGKLNIANTIKSQLFKTLWGGSYFYCSTSIKSFDQVGNALAIKWLLTDQTKIDSIINHRKKHFTLGLVNPPCLPKVDNVYLPCYLIGNQEYHNFGWTWVNLLFLSVMNDSEVELKLFETEIQKRGTMYEIYAAYGPTNQLFCRSQSDFSEAAGMYLMCSKKPKTTIKFDIIDVQEEDTPEYTEEETSEDTSEIFKWLGFGFVAVSGIIQAIRALTIADGTLSFWSQISVIIGSISQIIYFIFKKNWPFVLIQLGIIVLSSINIYDVVNMRGIDAITHV